jgi:phosphate transport system substrate-binding protein
VAAFWEPVVSVLQEFGLPGLLATLGLFVAALLGRLYSGRRRLVWEEELNTKIGLEPFGPHNSPDLRLFNSITVLVVKFRNAGWSAINASDYRTRPQVTLVGRSIVDFRASAVTPISLEDEIQLRIEKGGRVDDNAERTGWVVGPAANDPDEHDQARVIRDGLTQHDLRQSLPNALQAPASPAERERRRRLVLPPLAIPRGGQFRLIICCRDDDPGNRQREYIVRGAVDNLLPFDRRIVERGRRRKVFSLTRVLVAAIVALAVALVVVITVPRTPPQFCGSGAIVVTGSSAFVPVVAKAARPYVTACPQAKVTDVVSSSHEGIRALLRPDAKRDSTLVLSDGIGDDPTGQLQRQAIAVLIYAVVVNDDAGVDALTLEQIRGIMSGRLTSWAQLGGSDVPIRIVGRGPDSGSRAAFERYVLQEAEPRESSDDCTERDRVPTDPVIRCERSSTDEVLRQVAAVPGAIGYADAEAANAHPGLKIASLDGAAASRGSARNGYPFWTVEYAYTYGRPLPGGPLQSFLEHLSGDATARLVGEAGYEPCVLFDRSLDPLCVSDR